MGTDSGVCFTSEVEVANFPFDLVENGFYALPKYCFFVDKQLGKWYAEKNLSVEVVNLSRAKYPNRNALNQALDVYLDAMCQFVSECLDEQSISEALRLQSSDNLREKMEVKDIANLIKMRWLKSFKEKFKVVDREYIRYYDARSVTSLIIEGRNRASHPPWDLDIEFTRTQLFLIVEVLGKINRPNAQREVETIRNDLFENTTQQLVEIAVEEEKAQHKKSIAEVKERLTAEEKKNDKLSKQKTDNTAKLKKKEEDLEKLSEQLISVKLGKQKSEEHLNSTSRQLEKLQVVHSACEERLTTTEAEKDNYKERFETASKELAEAEMEWQACEDSLAAMRNLFTASAIGNMVFPPFETDSTVRILDRRGVDKRGFLLDLLKQKQPAIIYVQSEDKIKQLSEFVAREKADVIGEHNERTSEAEESEILEKLENGELIAVVSNTIFSTLTSSHCIEHFVFCHLVPGLDEFFKQCEPAFASEKHAYLHLIYNSEQDIEGLAQKYPDRKTLEKLYPELRKLAGTNGNIIGTGSLYSKLDMAKLGIETGLAIFEELQLLEHNDERIKLLPPAGKKLDASETYCRGERLKNGAAGFQSFQFELSTEQIWEALLKELNVDNEQILEASSVYEAHAFQDAIRDSGAQSDPSTDAVENDSKSDAEVSEAQSDRSTETVDDDNTVDGEDAEMKQPPKSTRADAKVTENQGKEKKLSIADRFRANTTEKDRNEIAARVVELRINEEGSKPAWKKIRKELGLKEDEFHKVIRPSEGYREAVIERIKKLRAQDGGWEYSGKLEVLTGIELTEEELA